MHTKKRLVAICLMFVLVTTYIGGRVSPIYGADEKNNISFEEIMTEGGGIKLNKQYIVDGKAYEVYQLSDVNESIFFTYINNQGEEKVVTELELLNKLAFVDRWSKEVKTAEYKKGLENFKEINLKTIDLYNRAIFAHTLSKTYGEMIPSLVTQNPTFYQEALIDDLTEDLAANALRACAYLYLCQYNDTVEDFIKDINNDKIRNFNVLTGHLQELENIRTTYQVTLDYMNNAFDIPENLVDSLKSIFIDDMLGGTIKALNIDELNQFYTLAQVPLALADGKNELVMSLEGVHVEIIDYLAKDMKIDNKVLKFIGDNLGTIIQDAVALSEF